MLIKGHIHMVLVFKCLKIYFMIEFIINNSQTHCSSYIKTSLENPGLIYFMIFYINMVHLNELDKKSSKSSILEYVINYRFHHVICNQSCVCNLPALLSASVSVTYTDFIHISEGVFMFGLHLNFS